MAETSRIKTAFKDSLIKRSIVLHSFFSACRDLQRLRDGVHGEQEHQPVALHAGQGHPGAVGREAGTRPLQGVQAHQAAAGERSLAGILHVDGSLFVKVRLCVGLGI